MRQETAAALGRAEAERWVMDGRWSGRSTAAEGRALLDGIEVLAEGIARRQESRQFHSKGAEWLLDNLHLVRRVGRAAAEGFRSGRDLPALSAPARTLRVVELGCAALRDLEGAEKKELLNYLSGAQEICVLTESELALYVPALQLELLRQLESVSRILYTQLETEEESQTAERMAYIFTALHSLNSISFGPALERLNRVDEALRGDPSGVYPAMTEESRRQYRAQVARLARRGKCSELEIARQAVDRAREGEKDVGSILFPPPQNGGGNWYRALILLPALVLSLFLSLGLSCWWGGVLLFLPLTELLKALLDGVAVKWVHPRPVFRLELEGGVPPEGRTLCVIAALLTGPESGAELVGKLERYYLANRSAGKELRFGLLADLPDSSRPMDGERQGWVERAREEIARLNRCYSARFFLFFRTPRYQPREDRYLGWERKRGALLELTRFLRSVPGGLRLLEGERGDLSGVRYLLTLDSDTALNMDAARKLIGAMLHPLNRAKVDRKKRVVTAGYGILQPRTAVSLSDAGRTPFARVLAGQGGVDPYGCAASDVYHDLFDRGTYTGKGILDVEAFHTCMEGRFPEGRVLSHDLLEGAYLRAGLLSDVELTDGFPVRCGSYFRRLHRWTRGDWQASPWLFSRVRTASGALESNPLTALDRWKLLDNLRRSLVPGFQLTALLAWICCSGPFFAVGGAVALLALCSDLFLSGADLFLRRFRGNSRRFHSVPMTGFIGAVVRTLVRLLLLPVQAWVCLSGAVTALWRMLVTRRKLLEWVTAAQSDSRTGGVEWTLVLPELAAGLTAIWCGQRVLGVLAGVVWLLSPLILRRMSRPTNRSVQIQKGDEAFLLHQASLIWGYFTDHLDAAHHYLPPDNVQERPVPEVAERTSPTNIGLTLLSCLSAWDLGLAGESETIALITLILDTVEELPKWRGHLYNWYDTRQACPMEPRYVSTVDSGNLCGCLIALSQGLREAGYGKLAARAKRLADGMDFAPLYDRERDLFYIGYDCGRKRYSGSWYDLMASEARLTSYLATARGDVPPRHWTRLNRALVGRGRYCGMVSWSGTMFEYFMPQLLLPAPADSMLYETLCFCACTQMDWGARAGLPWGVSESAYYALDEGDHYRYKAHGISLLGMKRELGRDRVVAPYATFLTLSLVPRAAVKNLKRLCSLGLEGRYGLCEAVDFTPERSEGRERGVPVYSWMVHHLGMSLVAIDNALRQQTMVLRFLSDPTMGACQELLQEKIPVFAPLMEGQSGWRRRRDVMRPKRWKLEGQGNDETRPSCHMLSNGSYSVLITGDGGGWSQCGDIRLTRDRDGIAVMVRTGDRIDPVYPAGRCGSQLRWRFQGDRAAITYDGPFFTAEETVCVSAGHDGELRRFRFQFREQAEEQDILLYLRPVLTRQASYLAHPAFSGLSVMTFGLPDGVVFRKLDQPERALTVRWSARGVRWTTNRFHAVNGVEGMGGPREGIVLDPCLFLRIPVEARHVDFRLAMVWEPLEESKRASQSVLAGGFGGASDLYGRLLEEARAYLERPLDLSGLLSRLIVPPRSACAEQARGQEALWPFGISGDDPIVAAVAGGERQEWCTWLALRHGVLSRLGFACDLVYLLPGEGTDEWEEFLRGMLTQLRMTEKLGARGGIHLVRGDRPGREAILSRAELVLQRDEPWSDPPCPPEEMVPASIIPRATRSARWSWEGSAFCIHTHGGLLPLRWSHVLANESFGWLADEAGTGHLWYGNAHENRITPWQNDPLADRGPEALTLNDGAREFSLFAARDGIDTQVRYDMGCAVWRKRVGETEVELTAFVPPDVPARVFLLRCAGGKGIRLSWSLTARLSDREGEGRFVRGRAEGNCLLLRNPANTLFPGQTVLLTASEPLAISGENPWELTCAPGERTVLIAGAFQEETERIHILALLEPGAAERALERTMAWWRERVCPLTARTPDAALDHYLNGWALYQVISCRLFARTGLYQCGGGYGFRDQLQDICALIPTAPDLARGHILRCCAHQFEEGDVQHWWHPEGTDRPERGVRTRISDDLLWLPWAVSEWVRCYGLDGLLKERVVFLRSPVLSLRERERYERPERSDQAATVYDHCVRAIECVLSRGAGEHGLCKMGGGDWNDGMNQIGIEGHGESVWLTWFLSDVLERWTEVARQAGHEAEAERYHALSLHFARQADRAWDGGWYLRGYDDGGQPFGGSGSAECAMDSVAQSWSVFAPNGNTAHGRAAVVAALERLWDRSSSTVALLAPPFGGLTDPGYIRNYPPGVRENGGQYTHGAIWLARACYRVGRDREGYDLLHALLPETHDHSRYLVEPYVLAGDVSMADGQLGRGGWSWYTGAAGWFYRVAREELLGLTLREGVLRIRPKLPDHWPGCGLTWRLGELELEIVMERGEVPGFLLDDIPATDEIDCRQLKGRHRISVTLPK